MSLVQHFKTNPTLETDIGQFEFKDDIGQGGNANVLKFERGGHPFAIKFIRHGEEKKLLRFRDEFFCTAQIPTHKNVVRSYHFDTKEIGGTLYSLIIMKFYTANLHKLGPVTGEPIEEQAVKVRQLFKDILSGLQHLHLHDIVHRDIKPQNIFYDSDAETFVIGDLGIAHFNAEIFAKESHTKPSERLANYLFSAPEQADSKNIVTVAADIYSLGQVLQWYLTGKTVRGLGRPRFSSGTPGGSFSILDRVVDKSLQNNPLDRFQSIGELRTFIEEQKKPARDPWVKLHAFDDAIRRSFPKIKEVLNVVDHEKIMRFLINFQEVCQKDEFWYVMADGGDNTFRGLEPLKGKSWLLNGDTEMTVHNLLVYRDQAYPYKNFIILLFGPDKKFPYKTLEGKSVRRATHASRTQDMGTLFDDQHYIDPAETENGYFELAGETHTVDRQRFKDRYRYLIPYAVMVVPTQTASACMLDRSPTVNLMKSAIEHKELQKPDLDLYLAATKRHHSSEITRYN